MEYPLGGPAIGWAASTQSVERSCCLKGLSLPAAIYSRRRPANYLPYGGLLMTQGVTEAPLAKDAGTTSTSTKYTYFFGGGKAEGNGSMKDTLGGKGAGLAEMTNAGLPVPPGFTIQTEACREYMRGN